MDFEKIMYAPYLALGNHSVDSKFDHWLDRISTNGTNEQPTTKSPSDNGGNTNFNDSYKLAAQVAVGAAIIVALAILLGLIWNSLKRRLPDNNNSGTSPTSRRYSSDSFDRLVEDRLRNRPPPYSQDHDKPPSYEESFQDSSSRPRLAASRGRERRRMQREMHREQTATVHETNRYPTQPVSQESPVSLPQPMPEPLVSPGVVVRTVSYDNRAFSVDDDQPTFDIPSISMVVYENEVSQACQNADTEEAVVMFHL
ncbi:uncharacterized protein LOC130694793 [Daphnia carinata]|uniref:uncharacterized protein LOC130694793 n=1 Tax=Daphnia carinata TaxID=120202 RepID=UPI00258049B3|nr:uncharacterized protein LOC130694793 [Daphnia carinata]